MYPWTYFLPPTKEFLMSQKVPSESSEQVPAGSLFTVFRLFRLLCWTCKLTGHLTGCRKEGRSLVSGWTDDDGWLDVAGMDWCV